MTTTTNVPNVSERQRQILAILVRDGESYTRQIRDQLPNCRAAFGFLERMFQSGLIERFDSGEHHDYWAVTKLGRDALNAATKPAKSAAKRTAKSSAKSAAKRTAKSAAKS